MLCAPCQDASCVGSGPTCRISPQLNHLQNALSPNSHTVLAHYVAVLRFCDFPVPLSTLSPWVVTWVQDRSPQTRLLPPSYIIPGSEK